ncbi:unnamed protein product [Prorocentrum cordatum]|uniref:Uncharacterized protein n=1 Tax=Prorocentrum cordatum TaxID=2364126 RepID=A0ABN9XLQ8_9DINO|nr:unnamed protein product [Polarella glacialis]
MEEDGRAALHAPCRAFDGVLGGTAGERAPRPPLLLESLAGPGSDDGFDDGCLDGPVDGDADGDTACPGPPARSEPDSHVLEYLDRFGAAVLSGGTAVELVRGAAGSERAAVAASAERFLPFLDEFGLAAVWPAVRSREWNRPWASPKAAPRIGFCSVSLHAETGQRSKPALRAYCCRRDFVVIIYHGDCFEVDGQ